jgi:hypothetical protein
MNSAATRLLSGKVTSSEKHQGLCVARVARANPRAQYRAVLRRRQGGVNYSGATASTTDQAAPVGSRRNGESSQERAFRPPSYKFGRQARFQPESQSAELL